MEDNKASSVIAGIFILIVIVLIGKWIWGYFVGHSQKNQQNVASVTTNTKPTETLNQIFGVTVPYPPSTVVAGAENGGAAIAFSAPANNGGLAITSYTAISSPGGITASSPSSPITITGLTNGVTYTFTVYATNNAGNSIKSAPSNTITPEPPVDTLALPPTSAFYIKAPISSSIQATDLSEYNTSLSIIVELGGEQTQGYLINQMDNSYVYYRLPQSVSPNYGEQFVGAIDILESLGATEIRY